MSVEMASISQLSRRVNGGRLAQMRWYAKFHRII